MNDRAARFDRLDSMIASGNIIRKQWTEGQERVCLLAALSPGAGASHSSSACPAWLLPSWFASLVPPMDDNGSAEAWPAFAMQHTDDVQVLTACKTVVALCESVVAGTNPSADAWAAAYRHLRRSGPHEYSHPGRTGIGNVFPGWDEFA